MLSRPNPPQKPAATDTTYLPFFRSFILGKSIDLDKVAQLSTPDLNLLNIETLAALDEARHNHEHVLNKQSEEGSTEYRRMKTASYFQAAIKIALSHRKEA